MSSEACWNEDEDYYGNVPYAIMLVAKGYSGERLYFIHPYRDPDKPQPTCSTARSLSKKERNIPTLHVFIPQPCENVNQIQTEFGLTTGMLAEILCVKQDSCEKNFEIKIDNIRFAGYPKKLNCSERTELFSIIFVLPASVDYHIVAAFQALSHKLAIAFSELQDVTAYFDEQEHIMNEELVGWEDLPAAERTSDPYVNVVKKSKLAATLVKVFDDALRTGVVQCFIDDYIEVGLCIQPKALIHNHLAPKSQAEIDQIVADIRPYHGILLLEDMWPTPDGNPHVPDFLKYCSPELSLEDLQYYSGIPLVQILQIVEHLLLWARAILIYPLSSQNVYTSATRPKPLNKLVHRFNQQFGSDVHLAAALAHFNPPAKLETFVRKNKLLCEQHGPARVVVFLLRHQLIMQLHKFCYIIAPLSGTDIPNSTESSESVAVRHTLMAETTPAGHDNWNTITSEIQEIVISITVNIAIDDGIETAQKRLLLFIDMIPFLHGEHHVEDMMYRLQTNRNELEEVITVYSLILSTFLRPDRFAGI